MPHLSCRKPAQCSSLAYCFVCAAPTSLYFALYSYIYLYIHLSIHLSTHTHIYIDISWLILFGVYPAMEHGAWGGSPSEHSCVLTTSIHVKLHPNNKSCITEDVKDFIKRKRLAFRNKDQLRSAQGELNQKLNKRPYEESIWKDDWLICAII
jgi:hypothetical protein